MQYWKVAIPPYGDLKKWASFKKFGDGVCVLFSVLNGYQELLVLENYENTTAPVGQVIFTKEYGPYSVDIGILSDNYYGIINIKSPDGTELTDGILVIYRWLLYTS